MQENWMRCDYGKRNKLVVEEGKFGRSGEESLDEEKLFEGARRKETGGECIGEIIKMKRGKLKRYSKNQLELLDSDDSDIGEDITSDNCRSEGGEEDGPSTDLSGFLDNRPDSEIEAEGAARRAEERRLASG